MKLLVYKVGGRGKEKSRGVVPNIERVLFVLFLVTFTLMIFVQAALLSPSIRTFLTVDSQLEGAPLGLEEYLYSEGKLELKLLNASGSNKLKILVNGDEAAVFSTRSVSISVKNGDVVEIDGSSLKNEAEVEIVSKSDNVSSECLNKRVKVQSNIKQLVKVQVQ